MPSVAGTTTGAPESRAARLRRAAASGSPSPPVTRSTLCASPDPITSTSPRPGTARQISSSRSTNAGDIGMPRPAPPPFGVVALRDRRRDPPVRRRRLRRRTPPVAPRATGAVEHGRDGDQRPERREQQGEHRPGHEPEHHGADQRDGRGDDRDRRSRRSRPGAGKIERVGLEELIGIGRRRDGGHRDGRGMHPLSPPRQPARDRDDARTLWKAALSRRLGRSRRRRARRR